MENTLEKIIEKVKELNVSKQGVCDISNFHPIGEKFPTAISFIMKYPNIPDGYDEEIFHNAILKTKQRLNKELKKFEQFLIQLNVDYLIISEGQDNKTLFGMFPHKTAAVNAGLGWIGKNTLLITEEFGPRVRLATVLLNIKSKYNTTLLENKCYDCTLCMDACPYNCIKGNQWYQGIKRKDMLESFKCSTIREEYINQIGHKHACGYCLLICPYGKKS